MNIPKHTRYRKRVGKYGSMNFRLDESVTDFSKAAMCFNFDTTGGALRDGYGLESNEIMPDRVKRFWEYRFYSEDDECYRKQYLFQHENGILRYYDVKGGYYKTLSGVGRPSMDAIQYRLNGKDTLLFSCKGQKLITWDSEHFIEHTDSPTISSMALHYERLFVTSMDEPTKIYFSDDLDPTNWTIGSDGAGFIELLDERGDLIKVVSFSNYLYVFREHGISRITAFADQKEFAVTHMYVTTGSIYPESIAKCGSYIMFSASDGIYKFDGYECHRVLTELSERVGVAAAGAYFDGKYFLSCLFDFDDDYEVGCEQDESYSANALIVYDITTGEHSLSRGLNITFMNAVNIVGEDCLMAYDTVGGSGVVKRCGARFTQPLLKCWKSPYTDFAMPDKRKALREVYIEGNEPCKLEIVADGKVIDKQVERGRKRVRVNACAQKVSVLIQTTANNCNYKPLTLIYSVI